MAAKDSTSKKPSDASLSPTKPQPEPVFFLDRGLGRHFVADALRAAGCSVELHDDHFAQDTEDDTWLTEVGRRRWIILTKDRNISSNQIEIIKLLQADVPCFNLSSAEMKGADMAAAFIHALGDIKRMINKHPWPFVASVTRSGRVQMLLTSAALLKKID